MHVLMRQHHDISPPGTQRWQNSEVQEFVPFSERLMHSVESWEEPLGKMVEIVMCFSNGEESKQQRGFIPRGARLKMRKITSVRATGSKSNNVEV